VPGARRGYDRGVITGMHAIVFSPQAEKVRQFLADVLDMRSVDAGGGASERDHGTRPAIFADQVP
jgi:hypothetical protein